MQRKLIARTDMNIPKKTHTVAMAGDIAERAHWKKKGEGDLRLLPTNTDEPGGIPARN